MQHEIKQINQCRWLRHSVAGLILVALLSSVPQLSRLSLYGIIAVHIALLMSIIAMRAILVYQLQQQREIPHQLLCILLALVSPSPIEQVDVRHSSFDELIQSQRLIAL